MATISIRGSDAAVLAESPVQRLLLAHELSGGALPADGRMLQELCALEGSEDRRRQRQRRQHWHARHRRLRPSAGCSIEL